VKFGLINTHPVPQGTSETAILRDSIEEYEYAEQLGYDAVFLAEHRFSMYGRPAIDVIAANVAARTSRIRIGVAVSVLPLHDPIETAERYATLDILSGGRLDFGVGRGNQPKEFAAAHVPMNEARERFHESLDVIVRAWAPGPFSYDGKFFQYRDLDVVPKPIQKPHPPLWQAAVSPTTVHEIVKRGINAFLAPYLVPYERLKQDYFDVWPRVLAEHGQTGKLAFAHNQLVYVAETDAEARRDAEEAAMWYVRAAAHLWANPDRSKIPEQYQFYAGISDYLNALSWDEVRDVSLIGSPDTVAKKLRYLHEECGVDYLLLFYHFGYMDHRKVMRSIELFAREVAPRFA
jgi:alkanesulfonate monooxygenase SsuD/methylene tetrahydromethanopterin reductase-like flavin-dependent oxidoreductase (luciferase family)